ncbi:hypothetical protein [Dactylosporangium salmoneum]|uniref:Protein kinase domain-containing protein n=1 Tax=Dactylosporangium salmoneum TaxID=53361 RepID=A0ABN3GB32_9ACTN
MRLYFEPGRPVVLTDPQPIGSGAQGLVVVGAGNPRFCFKVYRTVSGTRDERTAALLRLPPAAWPGTPEHHAAWPLHPLTDDTGHVRAVALRRVEGVSLHALFDPQQRQAALERPNWATLLRVARNLTRLFGRLHRAGVVVGDVSPGNVLVEPDGRVVLIDCDSVQFTDPATGRAFPAEHVTPEYAPGQALAHGDVSHDLFGLAVLICQLLMEGDHPFEGIPREGADRGIEGNIGAGASPLLEPHRFVPVPGRLTAELLPEPVVALARRAFSGDPTARPGTAEWDAALGEAQRELIGCRYDAAHFHRQGLSACVWCHRRHHGLGEHYPAAGGAATAPTAAALARRSRPAARRWA